MGVTGGWELRLNLVVTFIVLLMCSCDSDDEKKNQDSSGGKASTAASGQFVTAEKGAVQISCSESEESMKKKNVPGLTFGSSAIYVGYRQLPNNKDPVVVRFDSGVLKWCRQDYETTGDDNTGTGLYWDGLNSLYGVFTANGTQGSESEDFRRFARKGWLPNLGKGGGFKAAVIARINPETGNPDVATFLTALKGDGNSNSIGVTGLSVSNSTLIVKANAYSYPRQIDKSKMTCQGNSPFLYNLILDLDLTKAIQAIAEGCK
jgi:hypothetical protein